MKRDLKLSTSQKGDVSIINIIGDFTALTGGEIENVYQKVSKDGFKKILFSFDKEAYINSAGRAFLVGILVDCKKREQIICFTGLSDNFQRIFRLVGLTKYAKIFFSEESALKDFDKK